MPSFKFLHYAVVNFPIVEDNCVKLAGRTVTSDLIKLDNVRKRKRFATLS